MNAADTPTGYHAAHDDAKAGIGTPLISNPGAGAVPRTTATHARENANAFADELAVGPVEIKQRGRHTDGRTAFDLSCGDRIVDIEMPGLALENVRFLGREAGHNAWHFPRLYVDGSSWLWCYAVEIAREQLSPSDTQ